MSRHMTVSFGMVSVPVRLNNATGDERGGVAFKNLCPCHGQPIKNKSHCQVDDARIVAYGEYVKGFEKAKGAFVTFTAEELDDLPLRTTRAIDIQSFVEPSEIPFATFQTDVYYLTPDEMGQKAFALLLQALATTRKVGLAKVSMGTRERICTIEPWGASTLLLRTLHWPENVRNQADVALPAVTSAETKMAAALVDNLTGTWDPAEFQDGYKAAVLSAVEAKDAGLPMPKLTEAKGGAVDDLMAALKASIEATKTGKPVLVKKAAKKGKAA